MPETVNYLKFVWDVPWRAHQVQGTSMALCKAYSLNRYIHTFQARSRLSGIIIYWAHLQKKRLPRVCLHVPIGASGVP